MAHKHWSSVFAVYARLEPDRVEERKDVGRTHAIMRHTVRPHRFTLFSPSLCCGCCYCVLFFALGIRLVQELLRELMQAASSVVFSSGPCSPAFLRLRSHKGNSIVATAVGNPTTDSMAGKWAQKTVVIPPQRRGCHLITSKVPSSTSLALFLNPRTQI